MVHHFSVPSISILFGLLENTIKARSSLIYLRLQMSRKHFSQECIQKYKKKNVVTENSPFSAKLAISWSNFFCKLVITNRAILLGFAFCLFQNSNYSPMTNFKCREICSYSQTVRGNELQLGVTRLNSNRNSKKRNFITNNQTVRGNELQ